MKTTEDKVRLLAVIVRDMYHLNTLHKASLEVLDELCKIDDEKTSPFSASPSEQKSALQIK